eukprot:3197320-Rhodomonas_salina.1
MAHSHRDLDPLSEGPGLRLTRSRERRAPFGLRLGVIYFRTWRSAWGRLVSHWQIMNLPSHHGQGRREEARQRGSGAAERLRLRVWELRQGPLWSGLGSRSATVACAATAHRDHASSVQHGHTPSVRLLATPPLPVRRAVAADRERAGDLRWRLRLHLENAEMLTGGEQVELRLALPLPALC